ncbi:MAG: nitrite reductase [Planctomycetaceae bacterium]|nr:nitrite reductase [Planctomycetaceae bacterium]
MSEFRFICDVGSVPPRESRLFIVDEVPVAVFNLGGEFFALANECPHAGASLAHGNIDGDCVSCRIHHWRFSIRDGTYIDEEKPRYNARSFELRVVGGEVQVNLDA